MTMGNDDKKSVPIPAPDATRCEAGGGSCGAGQPLFTMSGLVFCAHHFDFPNSKEGRIAIATKQINEEK